MVEYRFNYLPAQEVETLLETTVVLLTEHRGIGECLVDRLVIHTSY